MSSKNRRASRNSYAAAGLPSPRQAFSRQNEDVIEMDQRHSFASASSAPSAPPLMYHQDTYGQNANEYQYEDETGSYRGSVFQPTQPPPKPRKSRLQRLEERINRPHVREQMAQRQYKIHWPIFIYVSAFVQVVMLIVSFVQNQALTGSVIESLSLNPMIGPSASTLIRLGARFVPCMKPNTFLSDKQIQCPASFSKAGDGQCTLDDICNLQGAVPNQWYRFISAMFLHGGVVHIAFNLFLQLSTGAQLEKQFGWFRIGPIFFLSGTFGFIFGGNFSPQSSISVGSSGALFGLISVLLIDLLQNWKITPNPRRDLASIGISIVVALAMGFIPGIDNFSHVGGFIMGILSGLLLIPSIQITSWDRWKKYAAMAISAVLICLLFYGLLWGFYQNKSDEICTWCKYFGCLPIGNLCDAYGTQ